MSISFVCPQCGFSCTVSESLIGRKAKCPKCKTVFVLGQTSTVLSTKTPPVSSTSVQSPETKSQPVQSQPILKSRTSEISPQKISLQKISLQNNPNQNNPNQNIPTQNVPNQNTPTQNIPNQNVPNQNIPTQNVPNQNTQIKKVPNPLESYDGNISLCPTIHTKEQLKRYRTMLLTPLQTPLPVEKMTIGYKIGLFLTALFMILLPIVYIGLIVGLCVLEYFYFVWTKDMEVTKGFTHIVLYFAVPAALGTVIIILIKPLIFSWFEKDSRFEITREREPLLFDFVQHLCTFVGAPMPRRIFVNCQVNAYAGMSYGIWGAVWGGNACDLMIGLPLVAGLKTSEFAGVLAHEFGHFTQAGTRRMDYIVRTLLSWFAHVYYYRDRMDTWLILGSNIWGIGLGFLVIRFFVWIIRRFIWLLMMLGQYAAGFMSRQMEYDADRFEIRLSGSSSFADTTKQIIKLNIANEKTISDIQYMLNEDRLPDNYPLLIAANLKIMNDKLDLWSTKTIQKNKTGFFDTHPSEADRIAAATKMAEPGVLHINLPASLFFRNFLALSREVSLDFYKKEAGLDLKPDMLKNAGTVIDQLRREHAGQEAIVQFFQRAYIQNRFLTFSAFELLKNINDTKSRLIQARNRQSGYAKEMLNMVKVYDKAERQVIQMIYLRELLRLKVKAQLPNAEFKLPKSFAEAARMLDISESQLSDYKSQIEMRDNAAAERLFYARELLKQPEIQNRIENGIVLHKRMEVLFPILDKIGKTQSEFTQTHQNFAAGILWLEFFPALSQDYAASLWRSIENTVDSLHRMCKRYHTIFSDTPYPFEHARSEITLGTFLVPDLNVTEWQLIDSYQAFDLLLGRLLTTYSLVLGECAAIGLAVEQALNLPPLPVPPPEKDNE